MTGLVYTTGARGVANDSCCTFAVLMAVGALILGGCGGGSGGNSGGGGGGGGGPIVTGGGFAPATGPGDTQNYLPAAIGNTWNMTYVATDANNVSTAGLLAVSIPGTKMVLGASATIFDQQDSAGGIGSGQDYYAITNGGVTFVGNADLADPLTPQLVPFVQLLFPVATGQQSRLTATGLSLGNDPQGKPVTLNMTQAISNDLFEDVATSAGLFTGALRQTTTVSGTVADSGSGRSFGLSGNDVRWYFPGAGLIEINSNRIPNFFANARASSIDPGDE